MWNLRSGLYASLVLVTCSVLGCNKAAPPPAPPAAPVAGGGGAGAGGGVADPSLPALPTNPAPAAAGAPASAAVSGPGPAPIKVDAAIQQRLLAIGAKLKQDHVLGGVQRNDMKQIGLAFHNFHDVHNGFPAVNGIGVEGAPAMNLSWRVMLLPYLEEAPLYNEFHLEEPWDSEHNKKLIARMPKFYGTNPEGKTRLHVLSGTGAPFQNDKGVGIRDITDGTSNTILAFEGGPDTAEIWTKPGGREFDAQQPLKSLGKVDQDFQVVMMDGAARKLPKSIAGEQFALLAQHQDGTAVDVEALAQGSTPGAGQAEAIKINDPVTPQGPAAPKMDLSFIPADAFFALAVHPRRVISHPVIKAVRDQIPAEAQQSLAEGAPWEMRNGLDQLGALRGELGIAVENLDEVVLVLDKSLPEALMSNPFAPPPIGVIVRNSAPLDVSGIVSNLSKFADGVAIVEHEGVAIVLGPGSPERRPAPMLLPPTLAPPSAPETPDFEEKKAPESTKKGAPKDEPCQVEKVEPASDEPNEPVPADMPAEERISVAFVTDSVVLLGAESVVKKMISARTSTAATTGLTRQLESLGNPLVALALDATPVEESLKSVMKDAPPPVSLFSPFVIGVKSINLTWDLDAKEFLSLATQFKSPDLAQGLYGMANGHFQELKGQYAPTREMLANDPNSAQALVYADQIVEGTKLTNAGDTISLVIPQIKDLDKLPIALKPAIDAANEAAANSQKKRNLQHFGIAFHNYHDVFRHFPALNGKGEKDQPSAGLSWRVYLLPFLDQAPLYNKFNLDEPWDSSTNKPLIKEMPKIFGSNAEGKTSIHVFTGEGVGLQLEKGISISDVTDGLSNTILVVEAGEDTAEIWTKPGGLTFDPQDPLKCLGSVKEEFRALLFDGSVRLIKKIDAENLAKAVQLSDGGTVEFPE